MCIRDRINDLLEKHLKTKADYRRSEIAYKKMLSNISHDIKTPMTVILGYLEIMQLSETPSKEMLKKVERKGRGDGPGAGNGGAGKGKSAPPASLLPGGCAHRHHDRDPFRRPHGRPAVVAKWRKLEEE